VQKKSVGKLCLPAEEALRTTVTLITFTAHKFDLLPAKNRHIGFYFCKEVKSQDFEI